MASKLQVVDKKYVHYQCSVCGAEVAYYDVKCPATGCGVVFDKETPSSVYPIP